MYILHAGSLNVRSGGPALSTYLTIKGLEKCGARVEVVMPPLNNQGRLIADDVVIHFTELYLQE